MRDYNYFGISFSLSIFTTIIYLFIIRSLEGVWLSVHLSLGIAYLLIILIGLFGMMRKRLWAPVPFLLLFAAHAIDGFYLFAIMRHWSVMLFIIIAIFALYRTVSQAGLYKDLRREDMQKRIKRREKIAKEIQRSVQQKTKKSASKKSAKKASKKASKKSSKKTSKKYLKCSKQSRT